MKKDVTVTEEVVMKSRIGYPDDPDADPEVRSNTNDCLMCITFIGWLGEAWPADDAATMPVFLPRPAVPRLRVHNDQADAMPFCEWCSRAYLVALGEFHKERLQREGQVPTPMGVRVAPDPNRIATPQKPGLILPGQPGFRTPR